MGKNKPRHNPDKRQNKKGFWCGSCDDGFKKQLGPKSWFDGDSWCICVHGEDVNICKGNPHNCIKTKYTKLASSHR